MNFVAIVVSWGSLTSRSCAGALDIHSVVFSPGETFGPQRVWKVPFWSGGSGSVRRMAGWPWHMDCLFRDMHIRPGFVWILGLALGCGTANNHESGKVPSGEAAKDPAPAPPPADPPPSAAAPTKETPGNA